MLTSPPKAGAIEHGGDPGALGAEWLDLSTGINPVPYPFPAPDAGAWTRLPRQAEMDELLAAALAYYRAPDLAHITATPGSQALIQLLPRLFGPQTVEIVAPTYGEHAVCWGRAGHKVELVPQAYAAHPESILIVVNPNNPDGRSCPPDQLEQMARTRTASGGWIVVDEAFADVTPDLSAADLVRDYNVVVLKSFGKFFGLAGLRLGFALAPPILTQTISDEFGPWAVSGPALEIATRAFTDPAWCQQTRDRLAHDALLLDEHLAGAGLEVSGGTDLFRLIRSPKASVLFEHLRSHGIYVRRFTDHPEWLRFGLPAPEDAQKLHAALADFSGQA